jgi:hypothetical protein
MQIFASVKNICWENMLVTSAEMTEKSSEPCTIAKQGDGDHRPVILHNANTGLFLHGVADALPGVPAICSVQEQGHRGVGGTDSPAILVIHKAQFAD